jgi:hypothetical protein
LALGLLLAPLPAGAGVSIFHHPVACVVAGRHPLLQACLTPAEAVGRAQVQFRAGDGVWYYVSMKPDGACYSALLPKPKREISSFQYFIYTVDRGFAEAQRPDTAPDQAYAPRVVTHQAECDAGMLVAKAQPSGAVVVGVARGADGAVLDAAAAQTAERQAVLQGFSPDGVSFANAPPSSGAGKESHSAKSGGGGAAKTLLVIGGLGAAGGLAAVAAGGKGGGSGSTPSSAPAAASPGELTGHWTGTLEEVKTFLNGPYAGTTCRAVRWQLTANLVQSASALTGDFQLGAGTAPPCGSSTETTTLTGSPLGSLTGTATGGALALQAGAVGLTGTYSTSKIEATGSYRTEGSSFVDRWMLTRQ